MTDCQSTNLFECTECYVVDHLLWRELPINPTLLSYRDAYISPVKHYHLSIDDALAVWGNEIQSE